MCTRQAQFSRKVQKAFMMSSTDLAFRILNVNHSSRSNATLIKFLHGSRCGVLRKIFFLFLHENIWCGYSIEAPQWSALMSTTTYVFVEKKKNYQQFLVGKQKKMPYLELCSCVSRKTYLSESLLWDDCHVYPQHVFFFCFFGLKCLFVLRFYGPVNPMGSCRAWSVYLTTRLLGRLSPLSG